MPEKEKEKDYSVLARVGFGVLGIGTGIASLALYADDAFGGVGVADDGIATSLGSVAIASFMIAFTGEDPGSSCDVY